MPGSIPILIAESDGASPVQPGSLAGGWISGTLANLALSTGFTIVFDLGNRWDEYAVVALTFNPTVGGAGGIAAGTTVTGNVAPGANNARRLGSAYPQGAVASTAFLAAMPNGSGAATFLLRPLGRYVNIVGATDATGNQGAGSKVTLAAYPS